MARVTSLAGFPIEQHDSPNKGGAMSDHRGIVLHIAQGTYRGTINWQLNPDQRYKDGTKVTTSSTWVVGREWGEWAQMVDSDLIAWCQRDGSRTWLSIELAGFAPQPPTSWQIEACAQLLAWAHKVHGIPLAVANHPGERGLGHHSMDREWLGEEWGHDECPGAGIIAAKPQIVARAKQIVGANQQIEEDDMPAFGIYHLPAGFAYDEKGRMINRAALLTLPLPVSRQLGSALPWGNVFLSAVTYHYGGGVTDLVVSLHDGNGWAVIERRVSIPEGGRHALPLPLPKDQRNGWGYQVVVGRAKRAANDTAADAPTAVLVEIGQG